MNSRSARKTLFDLSWLAIIAAWACLSTQVLLARTSLHRHNSPHKLPPPPRPSSGRGRNLRHPAASRRRPYCCRRHIRRGRTRKDLRPQRQEIVFTGEPAQDRQRALGFAAEAKEKTTVSVDPKTGTRAFIIVGDENWPFPVPIVKVNGKWSFDAKAGEQELLYRRIGANELDAIHICRGFVEAQDDYAFRSRKLYNVNEYAQRIISTPGKQDGLTWQTADGKWEGPIGEQIAKAIAQGYTPGDMPFHGYFYKVLKGQGPAAPLGNWTTSSKA